ncbi:YggS family pyridoxal phosphate-dependent enzyme [Desulfosediminicola flagellatus]|uniref:YggS family pyridoxal phosphate-dependent enzyme n=1 Tax=Desulfosediminicola flagellatus TaxID=2569541 RepID=UPI0010AB9558|nr:YggS family pyridoxal phosphate-dependent enzyme [Desulfosediminicola flagellatus]
MSIAENIETIKSNIITAAKECGRDPEDIQLVAVSKRFPVSAIEEAITCGHKVFGENYIQEAEEKYKTVGGKCHLHFIGHLQSNKAKIAARIFDVIETVDSLKLAKALNRHLEPLNRTIDILLQVNIGHDDAKSGVNPEAAEEILRELNLLSNIRVIGLMTMPPFTDDPELARPHFRELRLLADQLNQKDLFPQTNKVELSMGMSNDYHIAIQEGATIIRVGTAIFGHRL